VSDGGMPKHWLPWAKTDRKTGQVHRLIYHMTDVGVTARLLWDEVLSNPLRRQIADWLGLSVEDSGCAVAFIASTHDLGKASPAFQDHPSLPQAIRDRICRELETGGLRLPARAGEKHARHEMVSTWALDSEQLLMEVAQLPPELAVLVAQAVGGHHGAWPTSELLGPTRLKGQDKGDATWVAVRKALIDAMVDFFKPPMLASCDTDPTRQNTALTLISGIVSVADWLGSDEKHFHLEDGFVPVERYAERVRDSARAALKEADWRNAPSAVAFDFVKAFTFPSNRFQEKVIEEVQSAALPTLAIIEAPMGIGKTEAALATYASWAQTSDFTGLYIAMPTTATSNQMHGRVQRFLGSQHGQTISLLLVHSQALLQQMPEPTTTVEEPDKQGDRAAAQAWFLPRKKSLLAPFGVGTVDQALMSILQTKHFFVRLLGLSYKVVIFDEVHAYDAYMSVLFEHLLRWLRAVGASAIVLSATLPEKTRARLLAAWGAKPPPAARYPKLTWVEANGKARAIELPILEAKPLAFDWMAREPEAIVQRLKDELRHGGCAAVICNTVKRAQQIYQAVRDDEELKQCGPDNLILFHARFPLAWREGIETRVLDKFGPNRQDKAHPNPDRPVKAIVIATQVIEQSLDLDFDVMISDHAPLDLLLQRAGRLHRHGVNAAARQHLYRLLVTLPEIVDGAPQFERSDTLVYEAFVLLRSWLALRARDSQSIRIPDDVADLIEQVYGDSDIPDVSSEMTRKLAVAKDKMDAGERSDQFDAKRQLVGVPDDEWLLLGENIGLEEDDPRVHETFQALTRGDRPGVNVVCLHRVGERLCLEPDGTGSAYDPTATLNRDLIRELARHSVTIRRPDIEKYLLEPADPDSVGILKRWKEIAALRYHRVAIFENELCRLHGSSHTLRLTRTYGLEIDPKGGVNGFIQPD